MQYLLIHEDAEMSQENELVDWWLDSVDAGILSVVRFTDGRFEEMRVDGTWEMIE